MPELWKDLLQLGFSFAVAGYLLVTQTRLVSGLLHALQVQGSVLEAMKGTLVRLEDLVSYMVKYKAP